MRLIYLCVVLVACDQGRVTPTNGSGALAAPTKPLQVTWAESSGMTVGTVAGGGTIEAIGYKGNYHLTIKDLKGGEWKLGTRTGKLDSLYTLVDVPILDTLAQLTWDELAHVDPKTKLGLTLADGRGGEVALPPISLEYMVEEKLKDVEHGPVTFGTEPDDPNKTDSLLWPTGTEKRIGRFGKLFELDWVLVVNPGVDAKGKKVCSGYHDNANKPMPDLTVILRETEAVIYDRRTGNVVTKKVFPPDSDCPMFAMHAADKNEQDSSVPYQVVLAWAKTQVKR